MAITNEIETKKRKREDTDEVVSQMIAEEGHLEEVNSDTDLDDDKHEDDTREKYDHGSEKFPSHPAYDPDLEDVMSRLTDCIMELEEKSRLHASGSEALQNMHVNAKTLCERPKPIPPIFAVIGVRASGKF